MQLAVLRIGGVHVADEIRPGDGAQNAAPPGRPARHALRLRLGSANGVDEIIPVEQVTDAVIELFDNDVTGECWFVQAGRESQAFSFRGIPGPRA